MSRETYPERKHREAVRDGLRAHGTRSADWLRRAYLGGPMRASFACPTCGCPLSHVPTRHGYPSGVCLCCHPETGLRMLEELRTTVEAELEVDDGGRAR